MDQKAAESLRRSTKKFAKADEALRTANKDEVVDAAEGYLKARTAHQKQIEKVESA